MERHNNVRSRTPVCAEKGKDSFLLAKQREPHHSCLENLGNGPHPTPPRIRQPVCLAKRAEEQNRATPGKSICLRSKAEQFYDTRFRAPTTALPGRNGSYLRPHNKSICSGVCPKQVQDPQVGRPLLNSHCHSTWWVVFLADLR